MDENQVQKKQLNFRFGSFGGAVPMLFFVGWAIFLSIKQSATETGLVLGCLIGLTLGMFLVKDKWADYCENIFVGMAQKVGVVAIIAWFFAGIFAQVLKEGGFVNGLVWIAHVAGVEGATFTIVTFILAAMFSTAVGTGYGTVVAFTTLMYPAGLIMGAHPVVLFASILSGAAFGDNLAPVSDTTIVSAVTQDVDVPGVVRSRFKYCIFAAIPALIFLYIFGGASDGIGLSVEQAATYMANNADPKGLIYMIPFVLVIFLAMRGNNLIVSLTWGIITASILGIASGMIAPAKLFFIDSQEQVVGGAILNGVTGYINMAVLILLICAAGHIMTIGGTMDALKTNLFGIIKQSARRAELAMLSLIASLNVFITINTAAEIAASGFVKEVGDKFNIHGYRRANLLDATTSALGYIFPWSGAVLLGAATIKGLTGQYDFVKAIATTDVWPYVFHGWFLVAVMFIAVITGFGRIYKGENGETVSEKEYATQNRVTVNEYN
ncbi:MAG: Na+/H+ antiporter NhaC family protein [Desulfobacteraceae bacterium]|nr:Na+/H+ antiporter NhaC family protein [Desulfobacteraceae bacterium]